MLVLKLWLSTPHKGTTASIGTLHVQENKSIRKL